MHKPTEPKSEKIIISLPWSKVAIGHQDRTGHHVHDNRPKRQRTRSASKRAAIREFD